MKRNAIIAVSSLAILVAIAFGYQFVDSNSIIAKNSAPTLPKISVSPLDKTGSAGSITDITLGEVKSSFPDKVMVYKVIKPSITKEQVLSQANKLGISGEVKESQKDLSIRSQSGDYIVDKETGSFSYMTRGFELQTEPLDSLLSDEEYKKLATDFLLEKGLMREHAVFKVVNRGNVTLASDGSGKEVPFMIEVGFGRNLNGMEWNGVGPKISVYFGENGKIVGAASVWREVEPYKEYPVITLDEAVNQIKAGKAEIYNARMNDTVTITDAEVMYISDPIGYDQQFVIPYYITRGTNSIGSSITALTRAVPESLLVETPAAPAETAPQGIKKK